MRPGQQNKRGRGRNNNNNNSNSSNGNSGNHNNHNRKGSNPLTRTYDSSGPDVKIRGTAQHIAEKYATLARDAQSSGDRVIAENYLQHAEHYNRIIATAQSQMQERFQRDDREDRGDRGDYNNDGSDQDDQDQNANDGFQPAPQVKGQATHRTSGEQPVDGTGPQPVIEGTPVEVSLEEEQAPAEAKSRRRSAPRPRRQPRRGENGAKTDEEAAAEAAGTQPPEPPPLVVASE